MEIWILAAAIEIPMMTFFFVSEFMVNNIVIKIIKFDMRISFFIS